MNRFLNVASPWRAALMVSAAVLVSACGGGTSAEKFAPTRVVSFGDELSLIVDTANDGNGRKYTVNAVDATDKTKLDCSSNRVWNQGVAGTFGLSFPQCKGTSTSQTGVLRAEVGATTAGLTDQVTRHLASDTLSNKDLVTVMVGMNDVLALYSQYTGTNRDALIVQAEAAGTVLAQQVNRLADAGGKVIVTTMPDMSITPFAWAEDKRVGDTTRSQLLRDLTARFNAKMRVNIYNDGRRIGLVLGDEMMQAMAKFPLSYGLVNTVDAACLSTVALPNCTSETLGKDANNAAANAYTWMWADTYRMSASVQTRLGDLASTRALNNPFGG